MQYIRVYRIYYPKTEHTICVSSDVATLDEVENIHKNAQVSISFLCLPKTAEEIKLGELACIKNDRLDLIRNLKLSERDLFILSNGSSVT